MPTMAAAPDTLAIGNAIVAYLTSLAYPNTALVYTLAQLEAITDVIDLVANGGACCEVYGDKDNSERRGFGGRVWDSQTWFILSLCSVKTPVFSQQIYSIRDALIQPFQQHAQLGNQVSNLFHSQLNGSSRFFRVQRSGQWLRAHVAVLETRQEWQIPGGVIS